MRHCYLCDAAIPGSGHRRTVRTGSTSRVSVGRRVSASSGERRGLRLVCQGCAEGIDAGSRARPKAFGVAAVVALAVVALMSSGSRQGNAPPKIEDLVSSANASSAPTPSASRASSAASAPASAQRAARAEGTANAVAERLRSPLGLPPSQEVLGLAQSVTPTTLNPPSASSASWRHVTQAGTRWSLRRRDATAMVLLVDLGGGQAATVVVAPEFERLDMVAMNGRVDHIRRLITQDSPGQSASYTFRRDGTVVRSP